MKCSLKDGFINILLIILITPSEGIELPLYFETSSVLEKPMNFQQLRAAINRLQDLDSFPDDGDSENKLHKIVKKQMAFSDYGDGRKTKRSVVNMPATFGAGDGAAVDGKDNKKAKKAVNRLVLLEPNQYYGQKFDNQISEEILGKIKNFAKEKQSIFLKRVKKRNLPGKKKQSSLIRKDDADTDPPLESINQNKYLKLLSQMQTTSAKELFTHNMKTGKSAFPEGFIDEVTTPHEKDVGKTAAPQEKDFGKAATPQEKDFGKAAAPHEKDVGKAAAPHEKDFGKAAAPHEKDVGKAAAPHEKDVGKAAAPHEKDVGKAAAPHEKDLGKAATPHEKDVGKAAATHEKDLGKAAAPQEKDVGKVAPKKGNSAAKAGTPECKTQQETDLKNSKENECLSKTCTKIPDENDYRYYYECESYAFGCIKLKHKRCPDGQYFSFRYLKCLKGTPHLNLNNRQKRQTDLANRKTKKIDPTPEEPEPANEWMDASQGVSQKVPPEFKPKKAPGLKIYHLSVKRLSELLGRSIEKRHISERESPRTESYTKLIDETKGTVKRQNFLRHHPRSFLIRINKKSGKDNQDQSITENDENDNDEEDEETDEEDDDDEGEDDEEDSEEEIIENKENEKSNRKDSLKDLFKSAKMAVTNKAKFTERFPDEAGGSQKSSSSSKSKKSNESQDSLKAKKVLIDANIKVDSTIGNVLKYILKSKTKGRDMESRIRGDSESLISDRGSQDQLDPELMRMYEHLIRNNPRVKRYFLSNCANSRN